MAEQTEIQDDDGQEEARKLSLADSGPPTEIDGYTVLRQLGMGAYGTVWLAREDRTGRMVAIKYYPHRRGLNWSVLNREVEKLATLYTSRNIVRLLDVGWNAEPPYYVMEYVENGSLGDLLAKGPLSVDETVRIAKQVCLALVEAHGAGVLHCDLKPDNVLLDSQFQVRLCDFGQSRMSHEQSPALGTLYYMAPEQADLNAVPDARWDVYAVGALLYHMLTGGPPNRTPEFQAELQQAENLQDRLQRYSQHLRTANAASENRVLSGVDTHLTKIMEGCLQTDPASRLPNAQAILDQLASRERNKARRPLMVLGVLGPILLLCSLIPIFVVALRRNINEMEQQLIVNAQDSSVLTARAQANSLQDEVEDRLLEMELLVATPNMVEMLSGLMQRPSDGVVEEVRSLHDAEPAARPDWMRTLNGAKREIDDQNQARGKSLDTSWFLNDSTGRQLWRAPFSSTTVGKNYSWRDYFHGTDEDYDRDTVPADIKQIDQAHVSVAYVSEETKRYMVALTVPIRSADGSLIGLLSRSLHLGDLQERLGKDIQLSGNIQLGSDVQLSENSQLSRVVVLADSRDGQLLDHPWMQPSVQRDRTAAELRELFRRLHISDATLKPLGWDDSSGRSQTIRTSNYVDPVSNIDIESAQLYSGEWVAAMSSMGSEQMPWLVIVQERKDSALLPVRRMEQRSVRQVVYAVVASILTMGLLWLFVWRLYRRETALEYSSDVIDKKRE